MMVQGSRGFSSEVEDLGLGFAREEKGRRESSWRRVVLEGGVGGRIFGYVRGWVVCLA